MAQLGHLTLFSDQSKQWFLHALPISGIGNSSLDLSRFHCFNPFAILGVCTVTGPSDSINLYRVELQGIHTLLVALEYFCTQRQITSGGITIGCNNQGALKQTQQFNEQVPCAHPCVDLFWAITVLHLQSKFSLTFKYVPGHQDALSQLEDLPPLTHLNVWTDSLAK